MFTVTAGIRRPNHVNCHWVLAQLAPDDWKGLANWFFWLIRVYVSWLKPGAGAGPGRRPEGALVRAPQPRVSVSDHVMRGSLVFTAGLRALKAACDPGTVGLCGAAAGGRTSGDSAEFPGAFSSCPAALAV